MSESMPRGVNRISLRKYLRIALLPWAFAWAASTMAGSLTVSNFQPFVFASLTSPRDTAIGTEVSTRQAIYELRVENVGCPIEKSLRVDGTLVQGTTDTYQSNVPGIGVRFYTTSGWSGSWERAPSSSSYSPPRPTVAMPWLTRATLVVTGQLGSEQLSMPPSMTVTFSGSCFATVTRTQTIAPGTMIKSATCSVTTPAVSVTLPDVRSNDFAGVGAALGDTRFQIGLQCDAGANVYVTLTDATSPDNRSNLLTLAPGSTAQGVSLRVLQNGTPVHYGPDSAIVGNPNQWRLGQSASVRNLALTAQYVATGAVTPGIVKGKATFTMSYQ